MNELGICTNTLIPLRKQANESSEMVSQVLHGETYTVIESDNNWLKIKLHSDEYEGWIDMKAHHQLDTKQLNNIKRAAPVIATSPISYAIKTADSSQIPIVAGSEIHNSNMQIPLGVDYRNIIHSQNSNVIGDPEQTITNGAKSFLNAPYLWGGKSILGIDCSGLTQICFSLANITLPRDASQQVNEGQTINFIHEIKPADLAFFANNEGSITHVGIILDTNTIIHASGYVRIDHIDQQGIFNKEQNKYTHKLRTIKRISKTI